MTFAGWLLANIVLPMALPLLGMLAVLAALRKLAPPPEGLHIMAVVKDGQLAGP